MMIIFKIHGPENVRAALLLLLLLLLVFFWFGPPTFIFIRCLHNRRRARAILKPYVVRIAADGV